MAVAVISLLGSGGSIVMSNKLISYRLSKLEEVVQERGRIIERVYLLEKDQAIIKEQVREAETRLEKIERRP